MLKTIDLTSLVEEDLQNFQQPPAEEWVNHALEKPFMEKHKSLKKQRQPSHRISQIQISIPPALDPTAEPSTNQIPVKGLVNASPEGPVIQLHANEEALGSKLQKCEFSFQIHNQIPKIKK